MQNFFSALPKQYTESTKAEDADWRLGVGVFGAGVSGTALLSLAAPGTAYDDPVFGKDPQPAHMRDFVRTKTDSGGVHLHGGLPAP